MNYSNLSKKDIFEEYELYNSQIKEISDYFQFTRRNQFFVFKFFVFKDKTSLLKILKNRFLLDYYLSPYKEIKSKDIFLGVDIDLINIDISIKNKVIDLIEEIKNDYIESLILEDSNITQYEICNFEKSFIINKCESYFSLMKKYLEKKDKNKELKNIFIKDFDKNSVDSIEFELDNILNNLFKLIELYNILGIGDDSDIGNNLDKYYSLFNLSIETYAHDYIDFSIIINELSYGKRIFLYFIFNSDDIDYSTRLDGNTSTLVNQIHNFSLYLEEEKNYFENKEQIDIIKKIAGIKNNFNIKPNISNSFKYSYLKNSLNLLVRYFENKNVNLCYLEFYSNQYRPLILTESKEDKKVIKENINKSFESLDLNISSKSNMFSWQYKKDLLIDNLIIDYDTEMSFLEQFDSQKFRSIGCITCPIIFKDILVGIILLSNLYPHSNEPFDKEFKLIKEINLFAKDVWKDLSFDCINQITESLINIKDYDLPIEKCLNEGLVHTREMAIFPSIYLLTEKDNNIYHETLTIFDNIKENNVIYHEEELEQNYHLKNFYSLLEKYNNTQELTDARTIYIHKISNEDISLINKPLILVFIFKTYNFELFQEYFLSNVLDIIKNFIQSYLSRQKLLEKESIQAKLFGMLDHSIINDIKVYDLKLNKVINEIKEKNIDDTSILDDLNYITSRNLEREKILKATKNLLIPESKLSNNIEEFNLLDDITKELSETKQGKIISVKDEAKEKWEKTELILNVNNETIKTLEEYRVFLKFTISELFNNSIKYSPNPKTTSEKELIQVLSINYDSLFIKRGRVNFENSSRRKVEDALFVTENKENLLRKFENQENLNIISFNEFEETLKEKFKHFFIVSDDTNIYNDYQNKFNINFDPIELSIIDEKENNDDFFVISISNKLTSDAKVKFSSKDNLEKIFEKGERLNAQSTGTGLGLYIIRHILENRLGGKIKTEIINNSEWINIKCYINKKNFLK